MPTLLAIYLVVMFIWCCVGFVVGYVIEEGFGWACAIGIYTGLLWPLSLVGFVLVGIGKLILHIMYRE